jgi:hypothetical protein
MEIQLKDVMSGSRRDISAATDWIPLLDFALRNGVSLSTLRRHIKAGKIVYRIENGRYLLRDSPEDSALSASGDAHDPKVDLLQGQLRRAQEEIAELKMLVALYEEKLPPGKAI